ncbi:MAG: hypothetical protein Q7S57_04000 [bacterium]|nr:hypothetical protein [bacterium]
MEDRRVFEFYKPLRNYLKQLVLSEALAVIRAYSQYLWLKKPFSPDVEVDRRVLSKGFSVLNPWSLEILAREIIINSQEIGISRVDLKKWNNFANAIDKVREIENQISGTYTNQENILMEVYRISQRQFPWQEHGFDRAYVVRYFKIFNYPELANMVYGVTNLSIKEIYIIAFALLGVFQKYFSLEYPPSIDLGKTGIDNQKLNCFLKLFCCSIVDLKQKLISPLERRIDDTFAYYFHSFKKFPLIRMTISSKDSVVCPMPSLLFERFTSGLYYEIINEKYFSNYFGNAFESYVGEIIAETNKNYAYSYFPEEKTNTENEPKIDWIIDQDGVALFIECKTKRLTVAAKIELNDKTELNNQLDKLANAVVQIYKTIDHYKNNRYKNPIYKFDDDKRILPLVITLEDWFLMGPLLKTIENKVKAKLEENKLPSEWIDDMPFSLMSIGEFEDALSLIQRHGIGRVIGEKVSDKEMSTWTAASYLTARFKEELGKENCLFPDVYRDIFSTDLISSTEN